MNKAKSVGFAAILFSLGVAMPACAGGPPRLSGEARQRAIEAEKKQMAASMKKLSFYGKLVDQHGKPVAGATVTFSVNGVFLPQGWSSKRVEVTTKKDGLFSVENQSGYEIFIHSVTKSGYEFSRSQPYFTSDHRGEQTAKDKRAVIKIKKLGKTTFVLRAGPDLAHFQAGGKPVAIDISHNQAFWDGTHTKHGKPSEFVISAKLAKEQKEWILSFKGSDENDQVLLVDKQVSQAPAEGYQASASLRIPIETDTSASNKPVTRYLIVKSAQPKTYTRVKLNIDPKGAENCQIYCRLVINPYGRRIFEESKGLETHPHVYLSLNHQAVQALGKGELAPEPDLKKLFREDDAHPREHSWDKHLEKKSPNQKENYGP